MITLKTPEQIAGIRKVCHITADMFNELIPKVKAGMSTKQVDDMFKDYMISHGGKPAWWREDFPGATCISINNEVIHGIPSKKRIIKDGDLVSIDVGIDMDGYISDTTHSLLIGNVNPKVRKLQQVTEECLRAGIAACVVGNRISDIANAVYDIATRHGYGVVYDFCGHGVGLDVHEDPSVPNYGKKGTGPRLREGMVIAIEPMLTFGSEEIELDDNGLTAYTFDGSNAAHYEHTIAITDGEPIILTGVMK